MGMQHAAAKAKVHAAAKGKEHAAAKAKAKGTQPGPMGQHVGGG